jgi:hypothetical protein
MKPRRRHESHSESRQLARPASIGADYATPLLIALTLATLASGVFAPALIVAGAGLAIVPIWCVFATGALLWRLHKLDGLTWAIERATGVDMDGDGSIGAPASAPLRFVATTGVEPKQRKDADLEHIISRAVDVGLGFRQWEGHKLPSGKTVSREAWSDFLASLARANLAETQGNRKPARLLVDETQLRQSFGLD